ncbi:aldose epimerase [uncultured Gilvimarinus sp.]|uniref:aldose 1-epimerase n=1 Tax=uncultured Gilvimarinus sp. TaxID=1689143 RepID=UPI0030DDB3E7
MTGTKAIQLRAGQSSLTLYPALGGMINALEFATPQGVRNVVDGVAPGELPHNPGYRSAVLFPFPNRLRDGRYQFAGKRYQFAVNEAATQTALHGFLHRTEARVVEQEQTAEAHSITLSYACKAEPGYPFAVDVELSYTLRADGALDVELTVTNRDAEPIPLGTGWHPYYTLGCDLAECHLQTPDMQRCAIDDRMLPTGDYVADQRFSAPTLLGDTALDNCFALDGSVEGEQCVRFFNKSAGFGLALWQRTGVHGMNFLQLYTPPERQSLAVEPMSCGIDALNTGEGLQVLEPGQQYQGAFGVRLIKSV